MPLIRDFQPSDAVQVDALALSAFDQFKTDYQDWPVFQARLAHMSALASVGEIIVAERDGQLLGAVAYLGPGAPKADFFEPEWPIMRMLVVAPQARGQGAGRALVAECLRRARRDGASVFALHTSELMQIALPMYLRLGFRWAASVPDIHGVKYGVYLKALDRED